MPNKQSETRIFFGGWYQRTTLHLTEIYNLFAFGKSDLDLDPKKLKAFREEVGIESIKREAGYLEFVEIMTTSGIRIRYFEDGLYVLDMLSDDIVEANTLLAKFYEEKFAPAVAYIFSLGAPTPKELANIKTVHPVAVAVITENPKKYEIPESVFGEVYGSIEAPELVVKKTSGYIFLLAIKKYANFVEGLVDMQIFFREYKDQLQKYLNIHRSVWEEIETIKERKSISGGEVEKVRIKLEGYQKTINLISSRINQMGAYVHTRAGVSREMRLTDHLDSLFRYKFEVLTDTHAYIREIWLMTSNYLSSAIQMIGEIKQQATNKSIQSLQLITTYGVVGGIIGYLSRDTLPNITPTGGIYFLLLIVSTYIVNKIVSSLYQRSRYKLSFVDRVRKI